MSSIRSRCSTVAAAGLMMVSVIANGAVTRDLGYLPGEQQYADGRDRLDVHMPDGATNAPVVVFFHGGALMFGDKRQGDTVAERLLPLGIGVVAANYRLSPGVMHPAHVEDAAAALAWTVQNIAEYGGDPERVYVGGHSAGAYLAALLALDPAYVRARGINFEVIAGAVLISPFLYVEETAKERPKTVWGADPQDWLAASVTPHVGPGKPPFLVIYADGDDGWRKAQNERFAQTMRDAGNPSAEVFELPDRDHTSLITRMNEDGDGIGGRVRRFVQGSASD